LLLVRNTTSSSMLTPTRTKRRHKSAQHHEDLPQELR